MKSDQQNKKTLLIFALFLAGLCNYAFSQTSWTITGNSNIAAGTNYLGTRDPNDLVFRTNAVERGRVFGAGGAWRFGTATNFAKIDSTGKLTFGGTGKYVVGGNKYVFQYSTTPNYGLFFNSTTPQYEFRNSSATPVFTVNAATGAGTFASTLKIGAYTLPATDGSSGQVLKTNGSGAVSWGNVAGNYWSLTGNAGTVPSTNFIGTTDSKAFAIRTNNVERIRFGSAGNIGIGTQSPKGALNVIGTNYVSLASAGYLQLGDSTSYNMGMDVDVIQARYNASYSDLYLNYYGGTTYLGNSTNSYYGAVGYGSQYGLYGSTPGYAGVYGYSATSIGVNGYASTSGGVNSIGLNGYGNYGVYATTADNNTYYAGYFVGDVYSTTGVYAGSDQKLKQNIKDLPTAMNIINQLKPKTYDFRHDGNFGLMNLPQGNHFGLIAQDVEKVLPNLVKNSKFDVDKATHSPEKALNPKDTSAHQAKTAAAKTGEVIDFKALNYTELIPIMIKGMQEQQQTIAAQQKQIDDLKTMVLNLSQGKTISSSATGSSDMLSNVNLSSASLDQNVPNPLTNTTSIHYNVPAGNASLLVTDMYGKTMKTVTLQTGAGVVNIDASTLSAGAYSYTLIIDGKTIATKKMMVAH